MSYFHLQPFSLSPHLFPPSLVLIDSSFSFVESFPFAFMRAFTVRFSLLCVLFMIGDRFSSCSGSFSFGLRFFFSLHYGSSRSLSPLLCVGASAAVLLLCQLFVSLEVLHSPVSLSTSLLLSAVTCHLPVAFAFPPNPFSSVDYLPRGSGCGSVCLLLPFPFISSRLLSGLGGGGGGGVVHPSVPSFMGLLLRWQCSSLAWAVGSYGSGIAFLGSCCSPSLIEVVNLFLVITPFPLRFAPFYSSVSFLSPSLSFAVCF